MKNSHDLYRKKKNLDNFGQITKYILLGTLVQQGTSRCLTCQSMYKNHILTKLQSSAKTCNEIFLLIWEYFMYDLHLLHRRTLIVSK